MIWHGATWRFASAANRVAFEGDPRAYCPQYGGWCAHFVSVGEIVPTVPEAFTLHAGKLYLNQSRTVREIWRRDIEARIARADANWPGVLG